MAVQIFCPKCQSITTHSGQQDCLPCKERQYKEAEELWERLSMEEKLLDLYRRVVKIERERTSRSLYCS